MAQLNDLLVLGKSVLLGSIKSNAVHDLMYNGNEFTFASPGHSEDIWINYRTSSGDKDGKITGYRFGDGAGNLAPVYGSIFYGSFSGNAATATKATQDGSGNVITSTYVKKSGDTMTGPLTVGGATIAQGTSANIIGTAKQPTTVSNQLVLQKGAVFSGTAAEAGLVTRGICGVSTPEATGKCDKENLYINYDSDNTYRSNRQLVLQAGTTGTHYGSNLYQYAAARGDAVKGWVENSATAAKAAQLATSRTITLTGSVTGSGSFDGSENLNIETTTNHTHNYAGSASAGGSANSAVKLDSSAGSVTHPVYFSNGKPVATTYTLEASVPSGAKFTDTTYSAGTGLSLSGTTFNHSNSVTAGTAQGDASKTLAFGGTFTIPTVTYDAQGHITGKGTTTMTMPANPNTDTKNTTGATDTSSKIFLIGATSQTVNPQTYSHDTVYVGTDGCLYSNNTKVSVNGHTHSPNEITDGYTSSPFYINTHPENSPTIIPFINNDIAFLTKRGGSAVVKYDGTTQSTDISNVFDGSGSYWMVNPTGITTITIELTLHKTFAWGNTIYIDSGSNTWRAKEMTIEVMNTDSKYNDVWTTKGTIKNYNRSQWKISVSHTPVGASNAGGGFNKIRFTFKTWNDPTGFRLACLGVINYNSSGIREISLPLDGGTMYGGITPYKDNSYNLGSSSKKYANVYATNFQGNASTASKLGTVTLGSGVKPIYLNAGTATASTSTVGSGTQPLYMNAGTITASTSTVGGAAKPVYMSSGIITACSSSIGSGTKPVYMSSGTITASNATVGSSTIPVYLNAGTITQCSTTLDVSITGNAATATTASKLGFSTVGAVDRPIYLNAGSATPTTYRMVGTNSIATTALSISDDLLTGIWYVNDTSDILGNDDGVCIANQYDSNWISEIYQDYDTGQLAVRGKKNGTWQAWRTILDSTNYTSHLDDRYINVSGDTMTNTLTLHFPYQSTAGARYYSSALQIREAGDVGNTQNDLGYAPRIGFHWGQKAGSSLCMGSNGSFYFRNQNDDGYRDIWARNIIGNGYVQAKGGYLYSTCNGNELAIGSQNKLYCHFQNSANIPFYFNNKVLVDGALGIYDMNSNGVGTSFPSSPAIGQIFFKLI